MAQAVGNKAKGRQHSRQAARRVAKRVSRASRNRQRAIQRLKRIEAKKVAGIPHKPSPLICAALRPGPRGL